MSDEAKPVRPTRSCLADLRLQVPPISEPLSGHENPLIREAQRLPEIHAAAGAERIVAVKDRVWFKVKKSRWRGAATRLPEADRIDASPQVRHAPWWLGAAGYRRDGDPGDFYAALAAACLRAGNNSDQWLPAGWDWKRLELEHAYAWEFQIRVMIRKMIARSLRSGLPYQAEFQRYRVTSLVKAYGEEAYLVIGTENIADPKIFAVILNAIPGIDRECWLPEPDGVAGIEPSPGEVIWSTILPPSVAARLLDEFPDSD